MVTTLGDGPSLTLGPDQLLVTRRGRHDHVEVALALPGELSDLGEELFSGQSLVGDHKKAPHSYLDSVPIVRPGQAATGRAVTALRSPERGRGAVSSRGAESPAQVRDRNIARRLVHGQAATPAPMGLAFAPITVLVLREAPAGEEGATSASLALAETLGWALGTGVGGAAVAAAHANGWRIASGAGLALLAAAGATAGCLLVSGRLPGGRLVAEPGDLAPEPVSRTPTPPPAEGAPAGGR